MFNELNELVDRAYKKYNTAIDKRKNEEFDLNDITLYIHQLGARVSITALNIKTQRQIDLTAKKYSRIFDNYRKIGKVTNYFKNGLPEIVIEIDIKSKSDTIVELKKEVRELKIENNMNSSDIEFIKFLEDKFGSDYIRKTKKALELLDQTKLRRRNAGRKSKFNDEQIKEILDLREDGATIKELAIKFNCGVATIHKLITE